MPQSPSQEPPLYRAIRFGIFWLVRLFYPKIEIKGTENLPHNQPTIFVLNHPNGLIDPIILMIGLKRPVSFLAKSTLFGYPGLRAFVEAFGALPIFRKQDDGLRGGPRGDAGERNEATFARCREHLRQGGALALFPEGTTHSEPELLPLRTGAARIALSAEAESDWSMELQVVPVGLWYEDKTRFRSSALLVVGEPATLTEYADRYMADERAVVQAVTDRIDAAMDGVVLQAENAELLAAIPVVATWTALNRKPLTLSERHAWTEQLLTAYKQLHQTHPERLEEIAVKARGYANALYSLGISKPWVVEMPTANRGRVAGLIVRLILSFPLALGGLILSYLPYRLARPIARMAVGNDTTQVSTIKLIAGAVLTLLAWIIEGVVVGSYFGFWWGVLLVLLALPLTYIALRWGEGLLALRELFKGKWIRMQWGGVAQLLQKERQELAEQILDSVEMVGVKRDS